MNRARQTPPPHFPIPHSPVPRQATTLVELLIAIAILSVVGAAIGAAVTGQWRAHAAAAGASELRADLRDAADVLLGELRTLSPGGGDLLEATDTAIEARETIGASVLCSIAPARDRVVLPPLGTSAAGDLTWWRDAPAVGDSIAVLEPRLAAADTFTLHAIAGIGWGAGCPLSSGFVRSAAQVTAGIALDLAPPLAPAVPTGAPLRFLRQVRFSIYRSSSDNRWYLGRRELVPGRVPPWTVVQPVAGPFLPNRRGGGGGMSVLAYDSAGAALGPGSLTSARRLEIVLRAAATAPVLGLRGGALAPLRDSVVLALAFRNR